MVEENIIEAALFDSGGPVIIVPYIQQAPLRLDHIMVCWDGSRVAAPVDIEAVRNTDAARLRGRRRMRVENESGAKVSKKQPN